MNTLNLRCRALSVCAAVVFLAGCSSAANVTPMRGNAFAQSANQADRSIDSGFADVRHHPKQEDLNGNGTGGNPCVDHGRAGGVEIKNASGKARGPYPGTFTGSAGFHVICEGSGKTEISGGFAITSGPHSITGTFTGVGTYFCGTHQCSASSNTLAYGASIDGDPVSGSASGFFNAIGVYQLELKHL